MAKELIFLSHIHEEKEAALLIKSAIEDEFSGFVDVFVSSDGVSIPVGSNLLERIEKGLINCSAAIYLISPESIKKSWISFELGAIWIRSKISNQNGGKQIPALPFCYAGMTFGNLPQPISNLHAIMATSPADLEVAFKSLQSALGASGRIKTDLSILAENIKRIELKITEGKSLKRLFEIIDPENQCASSLLPKLHIIPDELIIINSTALQNLLPELNEIASKLKNVLSLSYGGMGMYNDPINGSSTKSDVNVQIKRDALLRHKEQIANR
ncbi:toll/interleukin-1 receptor domain-containing protein [Serratia plymuthica]|uniref:toll/interleukin-1 receptor domain-containing protein n=1 Tax=Serratia plymuthica TaxID=82996 RepID=UPI001F533739|nr:toll/interleukin-1 receptor domain-containing protein [Serratia plymuthica]UNK26350.1 toll/interleukin-1 receptor domain-containing protein [Serratia plymuthica]